MDNFMVEKRGEEIMTVLADFTAEWGKYSAHVDKLGRQITTVQRTFDELDGARSNQMDRKLRRIEQIQAGDRDEIVLDEPLVEGAESDANAVDALVFDEPDDDWPPLREVVSA
jgi:DNA anti-recombination protein RmuC